MHALTPNPACVTIEFVSFGLSFSKYFPERILRPFTFLIAYLLLSGGPLQAFDGPRRSTEVPRFDVAVDKALAYLRGAVATAKPHGGHHILAAYALIKCGVPKDDPFVAEAIAAAVSRSSNGPYQPISAYDHIYGSGVDSMLLADVDGDLYLPNLQAIAEYVQSAQRTDGSWSDGPQQPGDVSMSQYGVLALWACQRAGCTVSPAAVDRAAGFLMTKGNGDGGWGYRPGTTAGPGAGSSTHNMTMAGGGALGICRLMLHGLRNPPKQEKKKEEVLAGGLTRIDPLGDTNQFGSAFPDYGPQVAASALDGRVDRAFGWNLAHLQPVSRVEHNLYYYYCLERAAAVGDLGKINGEDLFMVYGDGLLELQGPDGGFNTF
ncbi:MAG TPA: terpene cyclase/mutase family protein, partial [Planctomycetaceae bacterium]|nr:terpene cyclase/mutase family protein [Planctomycetaceae bacterium]